MVQNNANPTVRRGDKLKVVLVLLDEPFDEVDLLEGDLDRVLVLGSAGRVGNPQLKYMIFTLIVNTR